MYTTNGFLAAHRLLSAEVLAYTYLIIFRHRNEGMARRYLHLVQVSS
jgi:hypothetical protein